MGLKEEQEHMETLPLELDSLPLIPEVEEVELGPKEHYPLDPCLRRGGGGLPERQVRAIHLVGVA